MARHILQGRVGDQPNADIGGGEVGFADRGGGVINTLTLTICQGSLDNYFSLGLVIVEVTARQVLKTSSYPIEHTHPGTDFFYFNFVISHVIYIYILNNQTYPFFFFLKKINHGSSSNLYRSYHPHRSRELVSPVCGIF